ncbi:MAG: Hsp20/alpha crystallin family protein [Euryarchaeota archaeon]|nr:Hsp20/alpha crystallin family protein [Euryarchaeota archaeon]
MANDRRGRRRDPWDDMFGSFDKEFEDMRRRMDMLMENFLSGSFEEIGQPMIYGFSMRVGPDGKPRIQQFGNTTPPQAQEVAGQREPLTDIIEEEDAVRVIVELPGVDKDDIQLRVEDYLLDIEVDREDRKFYKQLELPCPVDPENAEATYKNGVLEIILKRIEPNKRGFSIKIDGK